MPLNRYSYVLIILVILVIGYTVLPHNNADMKIEQQSTTTSTTSKQNNVQPSQSIANFKNTTQDITPSNSLKNTAQSLESKIQKISRLSKDELEQEVLTPLDFANSDPAKTTEDLIIEADEQIQQLNDLINKEGLPEIILTREQEQKFLKIEGTNAEKINMIKNQLQMIQRDL